MIELIDLARDILRRRCLQINGKLNVSLIKMLLDLQTCVNAYGIFTDEKAVEMIWAKIQACPEGTSAFLDGTIELRIKADLNLVKWNALVSLVQASVSIGKAANSTGPGPQGVYQRIMSDTERLELLNSHQWLVLVILFTMGTCIMTPDEILAHTPPEDKAA